VENARLNGVEERIEAHNTNCLDVSPDGVDRIVMGHFDSRDYLDHAFEVIGEGWLHVHDAVHEDDVGKLAEQLEEKHEVKSVETRRVKD
ncbi:MAG: SAM-dependent methyltransferase, partial [Halobacteria archaeon]|nr:SAM-dependent methyltransferase [Halobacteria archaeon]